MAITRDDVVAVLELHREEENGITYDEHGENDGTLNGGVGLSNDTPLAGGIGSFDFDGTDDKITNTSLSGVGADGSISFWCKTSNSTAFATFCQIGDLNSDRLIVQTDGTDGSSIRVYNNIGGANQTLEGSIDINDGAWHWVRVQLDGTNLSIYVDDTLDDSAAATESFSSIGTPQLTIGGTPSGSEINSLITGFWFTNRDLTSGEASSLYNSGDGVTYRSFFDLEESIDLYAPFDGDFTDATGTYTLTNNGTTSAGTGIIGTARNFDGTSNYVSTNLTRNVPIFFSAWINFDTGSSGDQVFFGSQDSGTNSVLYLALDSTGVLQATLRGDGGSLQQPQSSSSLSKGTWYHIGISITSSETKFYIDGVLDNTVSATWSGTMSLDQAHYIGTRNNAGTATSFGDMKMDEVAVFNRIPSDGEVRRLYSFGTGLRYEDLSNESFLIDRVWACYELNGDFTDAKNNTYDLTSAGSPTSNSSGGPTNLPEYYSFDGTDDVASSTDLIVDRNFSWGYWVKTTSTSNATVVMGTDTGTDVNYYQDAVIGAGTGGASVRDRNSSGTNRVESTTSVNSGSWFCVGGEYNSTGKAIWVDATEENSDTTLNEPSGVDKFLIAAFERSSGIEAYADIDLAQVVVFNSVLSSTEWNAYYNGGSGTQFPFYASSTLPSKIDDTSDFGAMLGASRQLVRDSNGDLFAVFDDGTNKTLEVWKSTDDGITWVQQDAANSPTVSYSVAVAIDSTDTLHIVFVEDDGGGNDLMRYVTFSSGAFGTPETVSSHGNVSGNGILTPISICVDSNDIPHIAYANRAVNIDNIRYRNRIGGSWNQQNPTQSYSGIDSISICVGPDDIPRICFIDVSASSLVSQEADQNNPTGWTEVDIDTSVNFTSGESGCSFGFDSNGEAWIAYVDDTNSNQINLAHHTGTDWTTNWTTTTNSNVGYEPSIYIDGTDIYVFYTDSADDDIKYDMYDGSSWAGEQTLQTGTYQDVKTKWALATQYDSGGNLISSLRKYYFDGSDAAASDPDNVWSNEANSTDGDISTVATTTSVQGTEINEYLEIQGTNASGSGTIVGVYARFHNGSEWSSPESVSAPSGGWDWSKVQGLESRAFVDEGPPGTYNLTVIIYEDGNAGSTNLYLDGVSSGSAQELSKIELITQTSDSAPIVDYLFSNGVDVYYDFVTLTSTLSKNSLADTNLQHVYRHGVGAPKATASTAGTQITFAPVGSYMLSNVVLKCRGDDPLDTTLKLTYNGTDTSTINIGNETDDFAWYTFPFSSPVFISGSPQTITVSSVNGSNYLINYGGPDNTGWSTRIS